MNCTGDPEHPDDRSEMQIAQDNPPQAGRVFTTWFWFDWLHNTASLSASFNKSIAIKTANAYLGQQNRAGSERPCLGVSGLSANGGTYPTSLANITIISPGSATVAGLDCPLIAEDGSAAAPQPLRVPCWVGRAGFRGVPGQVLAGGTTTQNLGFFLKVKPLTPAFTESKPNRKLSFAAQTAEYGCEIFGACAYTMTRFSGPDTYYAPDYQKPSPYPCTPSSSQLCWQDREQTAYVQVFAVPLGDSWQLIVSTSQVLASCMAGNGRYILISNFWSTYYAERGSFQQTKPADEVSAIAIAYGDTTTVTRSLFNGDATLTVTIAVSATGKITTCEVAIIPNQPIASTGPGWYDTFSKL